jgi:hypothetical protein
VPTVDNHACMRIKGDISGVVHTALVFSLYVHLKLSIYTWARNLFLYLKKKEMFIYDGSKEYFFLEKEKYLQTDLGRYSSLLRISSES